MDLAELISQLKSIGNQFNSWHGIETNVESIGDAINIDGVWKIEIKVKG